MSGRPDTAGPADRDAEIRAEAEARYREAATRLADGLDGAVHAWITRIVQQRLPADWSQDDTARLQPDIADVAAQTHERVAPKLRALLAADVETQAAGPLGVLRGCVGPANRLLADAGVPPPKRDPVTESMFPDDLYGLGPANFDDVDPALHDIGLVWGAAKAHVVLTRHHR